MANALVAITETHSWMGHARNYTVFGTLTVTAGPATYTIGGLPMSLINPKVKASKAPYNVDVSGRCIQAGQSQYSYLFIPGLTISSGKLKIFSPGGTELADASAIPTGVSGDTIVFEAQWKGMV